MNPIADQALVALAVAAAILALVGRRIPRLGSAKTGSPNCSGPCGCARQAAPLTRISANNQADGEPKAANPDEDEA